MKQIYTANNEEMASLKLQQFSSKWDKKYPVISDIVKPVELDDIIWYK